MSGIRTTGVPRIFELLIVLYVFHTTLPIWGYFTPAAVHGATVVVLYGLLIAYDKYFFWNLGRALPIFGIYILSLIYHGFSNFAMETYGLLQLFLYPVLAFYITRCASTKALKRMMIFIGLSYLATAITTYIGNQVFPLASRHLAAIFQSDDVQMYDVYMKMNIGGFNFTYALVLLTPVVVYMTRNKKIPVLIGAVLLVVFTASVIASEYTTALFVLLLTMIILLLLRRTFGAKQIIFLMSLIFLTVILFDQFLFPRLASLTGIFGSEVIDTRLLELSEYYLRGDAGDGDVGSRYELYMRSLTSFTQSPLWGGVNAKVGGHSYVFDTLGQYGLLGLAGMILMYRQIYRSLYKPFRDSDFYGYALFSFSVALTLAVLNPKDNLSVLTFMIPVSAAYFNKKTQA